MTKTTFLAAASAAALGLAAFAPPAAAQLTPLVQYDATFSGSGPVGSPIYDLSSFANDGQVLGTAAGGEVLTSTDVPPSAPAGALSYDFTGNTFVAGAARGRIVTDGINLLDKNQIIAAGGFTFETWFKFGPNGWGGNNAKFISNEGFEGLQIRNQSGVSGIQFRISSFGSNNVVTSQQTLAQLSDDAWHHAVASFYVTDGSNPNNIIGNMRLSIDGIAVDSIGRSLLNSNETGANSGIGFGGHPTATGDDYTGYLYNPTVYLGSIAVPEPGALALVGMAAAALAAGRRSRLARG